MSSPKIVVWDLETMPNPREVIKRLPGMGAWPGRTLKADLNSIICFGYKIVGEKKTYSINGWDYKKDWKKDRHNDYNVVKYAYEILKDADAIVTQNDPKSNKQMNITITVILFVIFLSLIVGYIVYKRFKKNPNKMSSPQG